MTSCRFLNTPRIVLQGSVLFAGVLFFSIFATFIAGEVTAAEVVQAYRKPSEADLQWLFDGQPMPSPSRVIQTGFTSPNCQPCEPVNLPTPPIPPAPKVVNNIPPMGILPPSEGGVMQMSGRQLLPPPPNVPKEPDMFAAAPVEPVIERLPVPSEQNVFDHSRHDVVVPNDEDLTCSPYDRRETIFSIPDMLDGSAWFSDYTIRTNTGQWTFPTMLLSRPNITEHFNAEVQNRFWADYRHWNNAISIVHDNIPQHKVVEQFMFGLETKILQNTSLELRVPILGQYESDQVNDSATSTELGNVSFFLKQVLKRNSLWTLSGGVGVSMPTAEDWWIDSGRLDNKMYHLVSFLGVQWHPNKDMFGHFVVQADMPIEKNELFIGSHQFVIEGQQMIRTGIQLGRWIYRNGSGVNSCRLGGFVEIDYAVVTNGMPEWRVSQDQSALTAVLGMPMVFGRLTCTNSMMLPISGNDRPMSVGYSFSLSRQF